MSVIVSTFLIFIFVDQLLLVDVFSQLYYLTQETTMPELPLQGFKIMKNLTQQFSLLIFTDFCYQSIKIT